MIDKNDIISIARHVLRRGQGIPDRRIMHPVRDWFIGVTVASALFVGGAAYAGILFTTISDDRGPNVATDESVAVYNQETVQEALEKYRLRTERFQELRADRSNAGDRTLVGDTVDEENGTSTEASTELESTATSSEEDV